MISHEELRELETLYLRVKDAQESFNDIVKAISEKHDLDSTGLGKFIRSKVNDKLAKLEAERNTVEQLSLWAEQRND